MTCPLPFNARRGVITLEKESEDVERLSLDWTDVVSATESISTSTWTVFPVSPMVTTSPLITGTLTSALVSAGDAGQLYEVTNTITTSTSQTYTQKIQIYVRGIPTIFAYSDC